MWRCLISTLEAAGASNLCNAPLGPARRADGGTLAARAMVSGTVFCSRPSGEVGEEGGEGLSVTPVYCRLRLRRRRRHTARHTAAAGKPPRDLLNPQWMGIKWPTIQRPSCNPLNTSEHFLSDAISRMNYNWIEERVLTP